MKRIATAVLVLAFAGGGTASAADVSRQARQFGDVRYAEVVTDKSKDLHLPEDETYFVNLSVMLDNLSIRDSRSGMSLLFEDQKCSSSAGLDGYELLTEAGWDQTIARVLKLAKDCGRSRPNLAALEARLRAEEPSLLEAVRHMKVRAIETIGPSPVRCRTQASPQPVEPFMPGPAGLPSCAAKPASGRKPQKR